MELEASLDELYRTAPAAFVGARNELARTLKKAGSAGDAAHVSRLVRPSPVAFAVNALHFHGKAVLERLMNAGAELRRVQEALALGDEFAEAKREHQQALRAAAERAVSLAEEGGVATSNAGFRRSLDMTLTVLSTQAGEDGSRPGRMAAELEPSGFDAITAVAPRPAPTAAATTTKAPPKASRAAKKAAEETVEAQEREVARLEKSLHDGQAKKIATAKEAEDLERRAEAARKARDEARRHVERETALLEDAKHELTTRRRALERLDS